jgi:hypothetical protein
MSDHLVTRGTNPKCQIRAQWLIEFERWRRNDKTGEYKLKKSEKRRELGKKQIKRADMA